MKLLILSAALALGLNVMASTTANPSVNPKVLKTFNLVFTNAQNVQWSTTKEYNEASFNSGMIKTRAIIDNNGKLIRTIRYYGESNLPSNILYKVRKKYDGKEIYGVAEVATESATEYFIIIRDSKNIYKVTADNSGDLIQTDKLKRADL
ncbi:MAG: hypothetical protein J7539_18635 [Niabella sp.]|nr:hypothetical protein [Niabella sp.]